MKAEIRDPATVAALRPLEVAAYLRAGGWIQREVQSQTRSVWTKDDQFEIVLPLTRELRDFALRMGDLLRVLEVAECRSQIEVFNDLTTTSADIVRIRASELDSADGTISLDEGVSLVGKAMDLMAAAACATVSPKAFYRARRPNEASEYLRGLRLGQTERGSFVVTVVSRVPPLLTIGPNARWEQTEEPFQRRVTYTLADALDAARSAAHSAITTGSFDSFTRAVRDGVSANLCDAIAAMARHLNETATLALELSWARTRPPREGTRAQFTFQPDFVTVLEEAARLFRERGPFEEFEVRGIVERLNRPEGAATGTTTILALIDDRFRRVSVTLGDPDYDLAIASHQDRAPLACEGVLVREGRSLVLQSPTNVRLEVDRD